VLRRRSGVTLAAVIAAGVVALAPGCSDGESTGAKPAADENLREAVKQVKERAREPGSAARGPLARRYALVATAYVKAHVRRAAFKARQRRGLPPPSGAEQALKLRAGRCGNATEVLMAILKDVGVRSRPVQFYFESGGIRQNHVAVEARWGGYWHYLDPTFATVMVRGGRVLPIATVLRSPDVLRYVRRVSAAGVPMSARLGHSVVFHLAGVRDRSVVIPPRGALTPPARRGSDGSLRFDLGNFPNAIGGITSYGGAPLRYDWRLRTAGRRHVRLRRTFTSCGRGARLVATAPNGRRTSVPVASLRRGANTVAVPAARSVTLSVRQQGAPCYLLVKAPSAV
jgi:transglutaminase superfamily protein